MKMSRITTLLSIVSIVFLAGCTKNLKYKSRRITPLTQATAHSSQTKEKVTISVKSFDAADQEYYFGSTTKNMHPVQISVNNNSNTTWVLSKNNVSLPLADTKAITSEYKATAWPSVGLGLLFWPIGVAHGVLSYNANKEIDTDIADKNIETATVISPEALRDAIIFSRSESDLQRFTVTLVDANNPDHVLNFKLTA